MHLLRQLRTLRSPVRIKFAIKYKNSFEAWPRMLLRWNPKSSGSGHLVSSVILPACALSMSARSLMSMNVMHCIAVKVLPVFRRSRIARGEASAIAFPIVKAVIDVSVKVVRPVKPGACSDEDAT